jgi:hypothetical protein
MTAFRELGLAILESLNLSGPARGMARFQHVIRWNFILLNSNDEMAMVPGLPTSNNEG